MCELEPEVKQAMLAWCVAQLVRPQLSYDSDRVGATEVAIGRLGTEPHVAFRPRAAFYWNRLNKRQILQIATDVIGPTWADKHRKDKKTDLIVFLEQAFHDPSADRTSRRRPTTRPVLGDARVRGVRPGPSGTAGDGGGRRYRSRLDAQPPNGDTDAPEGPATPAPDGDTELPAFLDD